ncbi:hypothetical protein [Leptothrix ochracea]|uniref:hypothetical protein n=1 Tax=Leptothrix ochracea TaxID=735331 RepID=UPI0034E2E722
MALSEIFAEPSGLVDIGEPDDAGYRSAALAIAAMPFLYIAAVPICYAVGVLLHSLRLFRFLSFMAGASCIAILLGLGIGMLLGASRRFGATDFLVTIAVTTVLSFITVLPAASCWWFFAVRPHNPSLNPDRFQRPG